MLEVIEKIAAARIEQRRGRWFLLGPDGARIEWCHTRAQAVELRRDCRTILEAMRRTGAATEVVPWDTEAA